MLTLIPWWHPSLHPPISVLPAEECSDLKGMFSLRIISVFWRLCCLFTCLCSEHDKRAAWRRKTTNSSPCCLNFSPQLFKFKFLFTRTNSFSLCPILFVLKKIHSSIICSQVSDHACVSVRLCVCGFFCFLWPLSFFFFVLVIHWKVLMYVWYKLCPWKCKYGKSS